MAVLVTMIVTLVLILSLTLAIVLSKSQSNQSESVEDPDRKIFKNELIMTVSNLLPSSPFSEDATLLSSESLPSNSDYMPEVGNGHVATVVQSGTIFMNGLYNGANITSHRARIPSSSGYNITSTIPANLKRMYTLDMARGVFHETYAGQGVSISLRTYAHRTFTSVLVSELVLERNSTDIHVEVTVTLHRGEASEDVDFTHLTNSILLGRTREAEYPELANQITFYILNSESIEGTHIMIDGAYTQTFLAMSIINVDLQVVQSEWNAALKSFADGLLLHYHVQEWTNMWTKGRIDVEGNLTVARINYASLYYILSSLPFNGGQKDWPFIGLSPGGLAHGSQGKDYLGHVFWDQDVWMFSPIALLYPDLGHILVQTRTRTLPAAKLLARRWGWDGAKYPWESAFTGLEVCPAEPYGEIEIHINGDVPLMVRQYWQLTWDKELMLNGSGADIVWETAKYWVSRATYEAQNGTYRIFNVMPPDEWHSPVNDSAYTNNIAANTLQFANILKQELGQAENATWTEVRNKMYLPYDPVGDYHPEFEGFRLNEYTKQADVILLAYPLMVNMNTSTRANDLNIYEKTTPIGPAPAMTWGMFLLGWLDLGNHRKAAELYARSILNAQQPFLVWSENSDGSGANNFLTGMGGYLQSVLFGYGGIRLYDNRMTVNPNLIDSTSKMTFTGLNYQGCSLDLQYDANNMTLTLTSEEPGYPGLQVSFADSPPWQNLTPGHNLRMKRQSFVLRRKE